MIVQPDFPEHWKTRRLVELTGDESAPMAVLRLWSHCQHNRRSYFPDMTPAQLSSICRWGDRKPACHVALTKAGFVDKLTPKGFTAHQWNEHNAQLFQKWEAGQKGGRPPSSEKTQKNNDSEKPTDNRPQTGPVPDQTRPDQIRSEREEKKKTSPDPIRQVASEEAATEIQQDGSGSFSFPFGSKDGSVGGLVKALVGKVTSDADYPTRDQALQEATRIAGNHWDTIQPWFTTWFSLMEKQTWRDKDGKPIRNWQKHLMAYVHECWRADRGVKTQRPNRNAGTFNANRDPHEFDHIGRVEAECHKSGNL